MLEGQHLVAGDFNLYNLLWAGSLRLTANLTNLARDLATLYALLLRLLTR